MGEVNLDKLVVGESYNTEYLSELWNFKSAHCFTGTFHPSNSDQVLLFVSKKKTSDRIQYNDNLENGVLVMDGQKEHRSDKFMVNTIKKIKIYKFYLFYRETRKEKGSYCPYVYYGECYPTEYEEHSDKPSRFKFRLCNSLSITDIDGFTDYITTQKDVFTAAPEGVKKLITHYRYERNASNRKKAIEINGCICKVCGFDFNKVYGEDLAKDYIEVHHVTAISNGIQTPNPEKDLVPVCANCHRMLHRENNSILSVEELKKIVEKHKNN